MKIKMIDQSMRKVLGKYLSKMKFLVLEAGAKHARIRNLQSGDWLPVSGSSGDHRSAKNFEASLSRLAFSGQGFIFSKTGHLPVIPAHTNT
jgi:hypothetical protein